MSMPPSQDPARPPGAEPSEEELRAAYEAELDRVNAIDVVAQAAVSLLNIGARKLGPPGPPAPPAPGGEPPRTAPGRDLEQARDAIDGAAALLAIVERRLPNEARPLKDALSRLKMAYASEAGAAAPPAAHGADASPRSATGGPAGSDAGAAEAPSETPAQGHESGSDPRRPGPAESSGRLWVPGR